MHGDTVLTRTPLLAERLSSLPCNFDKLGGLRDEFSDVLFSIDGSKSKGKGSGRYLLLFANGIVSCKSREGTQLSVKEFYDFERDFHCSFPDLRSLMITDRDGATEGPIYYLRNVNVPERLGWLTNVASIQSPAVTSPSSKKPRSLNQLLGRDRINSAHKTGKREPVGGLPRTSTMPSRGSELPAALEGSPPVRSRVVTVNGRSSPLGKGRLKLGGLLGETNVDEKVSDRGSLACSHVLWTTLLSLVGCSLQPEGEVDWLRHQRALQQAVSELTAENQQLEEDLRRVVDDAAQLKINTIEAIARTEPHSSRLTNLVALLARPLMTTLLLSLHGR